jgi:hypothetical protein
MLSLCGICIYIQTGILCAAVVQEGGPFTWYPLCTPAAHSMPVYQQIERLKGWACCVCVDFAVVHQHWYLADCSMDAPALVPG